MQALDPKIASQADLIQPYLQMKQYDLVYRIMFEALDADRMAWVHGWDAMHVWSADVAEFRRDPRFGLLAQRMGLVEYWKQYGYPDGCRAGSGDVPLVCAT